MRSNVSIVTRCGILEEAWVLEGCVVFEEACLEMKQAVQNLFVTYFQRSDI